MRWLGVAGTVLGLWILLAPWICDFVTVTWVNVVIGVVIAASSLAAVFTGSKT